mgnify:CR=1 FL=1
MTRLLAQAGIALAGDVEHQPRLGRGRRARHPNGDRILAGGNVRRRRNAELEGLGFTGLDRDAGELLAAVLLLEHRLEAGRGLGDEIGAVLGARMGVRLIGERPGLSAPDSLGAYLTFAPRIGLTDEKRNCVSNIHGTGLRYDEAAFKIAWLVREGIARQVTGVALKDESGAALIAGTEAETKKD